jgi:small-conductance mechanosensitive channel
MATLLKDSYLYIKPYLLNGVFSYSLFGIYALTIAPFVGDFVASGEYNPFLSLFGFGMLVAEFFALKFKLKMIRVRAGQRRIEHYKKTGINILPNTNMFVLFEFFLRLLFRVPIAMVCMAALGYTANEKKMSGESVFVIMLVLVADIAGLAYLFLKSDFYTDPPLNKKKLQNELIEDNVWDKANGHLMTSEKHMKLELLSDVVLHVYAIMVYTALWSYLNGYGIGHLNSIVFIEYANPVSAAFEIFPWLFIMCIFALIPLRIAYWIEDSLMAFTWLEKFELVVTFIIIALFTCSPTIWRFVSIFYLKEYTRLDEAPTDMGDWGAVALFLSLLLLRLLLFAIKRKKHAPIS